MKKLWWYVRHPYYVTRVHIHNKLHGHYPVTHDPSLSDWDCIVCDPMLCSEKGCGFA